MAPTSTSLEFKVIRRQTELVRPAMPTPREFKLLSDIDDQESLRFHVPGINIYRNDPSMRERDPVKVIREALARTLVFYYPFAGRLRELDGHNRKLVVECTGEGALFTEADSDVMLDHLGEEFFRPPIPCLDELLYNVPGSDGILDCPLLLIQVTRFKCGGFIFAIRLNHTMSDAIGMAQFMNAVGEMARGADAPNVLPVWQRELLNARDPPHVTCTHHEYDEVDDSKGTIINFDDMENRSFFFGPAEVSTLLRRFLPFNLRSCSKIEVLTACLWRCRTIALQLDPTEEVRMLCIVNARSKFNPPLPSGYYGNAFAFPAAVTTAGKLCEKPLGYALELVKNAKNEVTEDYMKSVADHMVLKGRPPITMDGTFVVSDLRRAGARDVDFGWGKAIYGGPAKGGPGDFPGFTSFYIPLKNGNGENGIVVPICLPAAAMERFAKELDNMLNDQQVRETTTNTSNINSAL